MSTKRKAATKLAMPVSRPSAKKATKFSIDESQTAVAAADPVLSKPAETVTIEISSDSSESEYDVSDAEDEEEEHGDGATEQSQPAHQGTKSGSLIPNGISHHDEDEEMQEVTAKDDDEEEKEEDDEDADAAPTFGDLVRANEPIDVPSGLNSKSLSLTHPSGKALATPSLSSLGTVLTQALRTDDSDLLESCFAVADITTVRNTIQRLDSGLAGLLLTKLAGRLHRRPGRAGTLMGWVQWTLVAHGGALAAQPDLVKKLTDLNRVLEERARGLGSLLVLKGKLDMLESQMNLRRATRKLQLGNEEDHEDDDRVIYVAGDNAHATDDEVDIDDDALVMANGVEETDSDDEEESDEANEQEPSAGEDEVYEDEVIHEDVESDEEEEESDFADAVAPPAKMQKTSAGFSKRR